MRNLKTIVANQSAANPVTAALKEAANLIALATQALGTQISGEELAEIKALKAKITSGQRQLTKAMKKVETVSSPASNIVPFRQRKLQEIGQALGQQQADGIDVSIPKDLHRNMLHIRNIGMERITAQLNGKRGGQGGQSTVAKTMTPVNVTKVIKVTKGQSAKAIVAKAEALDATDDHKDKVEMVSAEPKKEKKQLAKIESGQKLGGFRALAQAADVKIEETTVAPQVEIVRVQKDNPSFQPRQRRSGGRRKPQGYDAQATQADLQKKAALAEAKRKALEANRKTEEKKVEMVSTYEVKKNSKGKVVVKAISRPATKATPAPQPVATKIESKKQKVETVSTETKKANKPGRKARKEAKNRARYGVKQAKGQPKQKKSKGSAGLNTKEARKAKRRNKGKSGSSSDNTKNQGAEGRKNTGSSNKKK